MKPSRILTVTAIAAATLLTVAGCSPSSSSTAAGGGSAENCSGDVTNLSVWSWRTEDVKTYEKIFDAFEQENPCITIEFQAFKNTEYQQILQTGLGGSDGPDVAQVRAYGQLQPFVEGGSLVALDDIVPEVKDFDETTLNGAKGKADGKIYGVPFATQTLQVYYNKKIFKDNNLEVPTTWDEFVDVNEALVKAGITPLSVGARDAWILPMVHDIFGSAQYGGSEFEAKILAGDTTFDDPNYVGSIETLKSLEPFMPKDVVGVSYTDSQVLFTSEQAAMFPGGSFELSFFQKQNPNLDLGVFQAPIPKDSVLDHSVTPSYADGNWAISATSKKQEAAETLTKWFATAEFGQLVADELKQFSPVPGVTYNDPVMKETWDLYQEASSPYLLLVDFRYGQPLGSDLMGEGGQQLFLGELDAAGVASKIQTGVSQWFTPR
ncbi:ABC transporter substrate-binding protein [Lysinibacter cavernae]|uniref:Raffinose/stachyose/melibiose transport system substrate-binding protein n=1 Tax=Lysinibacter cavernae TaxID=1640652 RepID=A0A7X5R221_9MICO|nr:extracellular solute-binding protein [Lysinibacter cavernae]NIH54042.1 raffinose/stachyose/melibiose transport system substrate-binding protein [Lysinibacter cavernae]